MKNPMQSFMRRATDLTRAGWIQEAVAVIQAGLGFRTSAAHSADQKSSKERNYAKEIHGELAHAEHVPVAHIPTLQFPTAQIRPSTVPEIREMLQPSPAPIVPHVVADSRPGTFTDGDFAFNGKTHHYKLFVPGAAASSPRAMVVLLHGCTQDPDDFALGTDMNDIAGAAGWVVLYPAQSARANHTKCWNWFKSGVEPGAGEPMWIAALTQRIQYEQHIDSDRTFIAGLSAGAAMAVLTAELHPELFKGVGVHSGLAAHVAANVMEALSVMKHGPRARQKRFYSTGSTASNPIIPVIVFHGDADKTVDLENADQVIDVAIARAKQAEPGLVVNESENKGAANGTSFTQVIYTGTANRPIAEYWRLHGAGHAWSGGNDRGSHTSASGPSASAEFLRFFAAVSKAPAEYGN